MTEEMEFEPTRCEVCGGTKSIAFDEDGCPVECDACEGTGWATPADMLLAETQAQGDVK